MGKSISKTGLATAFCDVALATLYLAFAIAHVRAFVSDARLSLALIVVTETLFAVFFLTRREAATVSFSAVSLNSAVLGTFLPLLLRPNSGAQDLALAALVQSAGVAFSVIGILSLNRSIGLLPANRGIRTGGAYRCVRHPLYASYTVAQLGYLGSNPSLTNALVCIIGFSAQILRIHQEEKLLLRDREYARYALRTRWRLLPFVY